MGILDDLAMGFGLKERTADYDARTARTIAANQASAEKSGSGNHAAMIAGIKARQRYNPSEPTPQGRYYLDRAGAQGGYAAGQYRPAIAEDQRPFMQRLLYSPESAPSPNPYAIGPVSMEKPLQIPSMLGILNSFANAAFDRPLTGKPLSSGAVDALDGVKPFKKVATPAGILPADDGQITEEELADVTGEPTASNEFEGMNAMEIKDALLAKFGETGEDPTLEYDAEELFDNDNVFINYLKTKPMEDRATAFANRLAGR